MSTTAIRQHASAYAPLERAENAQRILEATTDRRAYANGTEWCYRIYVNGTAARMLRGTMKDGRERYLAALAGYGVGGSRLFIDSAVGRDRKWIAVGEPGNFDLLPLIANNAEQNVRPAGMSLMLDAQFMKMQMGRIIVFCSRDVQQCIAGKIREGYYLNRPANGINIRK